MEREEKAEEEGRKSEKSYRGTKEAVEVEENSKLLTST